MMKLRYSVLLFVVLIAGLFSTQSRAADKKVHKDAAARFAKLLTLEVNSEKSSNVFWDSETMETHTPILLSWRVDCAIPATSRVEVRWRLLNAKGKNVMSGGRKYDIEQGNYAAGRELFSPKERGAYLWVARATIKLDGRDLVKTASMPLVVVVAPPNSSSAFLSVENPVSTASVSSDFYQRLGISHFSDEQSALPIPEDNVNPAARRRVMLFAKSKAKGANFILRDDDATPPFSQDISPRDSAIALAQNTVMAYGSGAAGYAISMNSANAPIIFSSNSDDTNQLVSWERAAAFTAANHLLGDAQFVKELFPDTPAIYAALFQSANSSIAVVWSNQDNDGRLALLLPGAELLDANGNQIAQAGKNGKLKIPLTHDLYYVRAKLSPEALSRAMRAGAIEGMASVRAQVLPITQLTDSDNARQLQVRLQNITPHPCSGVLTLDAPDGWKLDNDSQQFVLQPGQWRVCSFAVTKARANYSNQVRVKVRVNNGVTGNWNWTVDPPVATADNWTPKSTFTLDGSLDDWKDATWMKAENDQFDRKAAVAVRWDAQNLYIAAKVDEPRFISRQNDDPAYRFWNSDALQLAFGWREDPWMQPSSANFRDTDYGFVIAPFDKNDNGSIEGRVLTLWNPTTPFGGAADQVRWGGAVNGASCRITFDSKQKQAIYEAVIPLSALGDLNPQSRIATNTAPDQPIRFSWIAHTFDGVPVQWSKAAGVFPWWGNSGSFLPVKKGYLAAQTLLGFSQRDASQREDGKNTKENVPSVNSIPGNNNSQQLPPMPPQQPRQPVQPLQPTTPSPPQNQVPSLPNPVPVQPIPPNLLPPAPPES